MPPRLRYLVYFLDIEIYCASRGRPCESAVLVRICYRLFVSKHTIIPKVVIKILHGSVVTQTVLGGLTIYPRVANFPPIIFARNYKSWLAVDKVNQQLILFGPPCIRFCHYALKSIFVQLIRFSLYFFSSGAFFLVIIRFLFSKSFSFSSAKITQSNTFQGVRMRQSRVWWQMSS